MKIDILTLFPEMFTAIKTSILGRAQNSGNLKINLINIRDFSKDKHKKCDDAPFGGGAGMLMTAQPIYDAVQSVKGANTCVLFTSPKGKIFDQKMSEELAKMEHIVIVCGHYEGYDERVIKLCNGVEVSLGNFVLTGGEIPAMAITDCVARHIDGVLNQKSLEEESFSNGVLEYPQYTRPADFMGEKVPDVLLSGNHQDIARWRENHSKKI